MTSKLKLRLGPLANHHLSSQLSYSAEVQGLAFIVSSPTVAPGAKWCFWRWHWVGLVMGVIGRGEGPMGWKWGRWGQKAGGLISSKGCSSVSGPFSQWLLQIKGECGKGYPLSSAPGGSAKPVKLGLQREPCSSHLWMPEVPRSGYMRLNLVDGSNGCHRVHKAIANSYL